MSVLPKVEAQAFTGICAQGQTLPLYLVCDPPEGETVFQTKIASVRSGLTVRELALELLGTLLAERLDLYCPAPAAVHVAGPVRQEIEDRHRFECRDAWGFGSIWVRGTAPFWPEVDVQELPPEECSRLLALDLLLSNGDRTPANPNVCWNGSRLMVFDFEHSFELPRVDFERRFRLHLDSLEPLYASHLACEGADRTGVLESVANALAPESVVSFEAAVSDLPDSWREDWRDHLDYLGYIGTQRDRMLERIGGLSL